MTKIDYLGQEFSRLYVILTQLRRECPWDKKQTAESLRQYLLEEVFEVVNTIDHADWPELSKELGDLLLQIVFQSIIAEEKGYFTLLEVLTLINQKMVERHPHVFGGTKVDSAEEVADNWEHIKIHKEKRPSILSGIPDNTASLLRAQRIQDKASRVGFDWKNVEDVLDKVEEEIRELREAINANQQAKIRAEFGDLLFSLVNFARFIDVVAEDALRLAVNKFIRRFQQIEKYYGHDYTKIKAASLAELDQIWEKTKEHTGDG